MSTRHRIRFILLAAGIVAALVQSACTTVQPWQRGNLADPLMQPDHDPLHTVMTEHVHFSREGSSGGRGIGGGGCGCN
jgi:hypothetical protein